MDTKRREEEEKKKRKYIHVRSHAVVQTDGIKAVLFPVQHSVNIATVTSRTQNDTRFCILSSKHVVSRNKIRYCVILTGALI